jgi:hypothetical protein
MTLGAQAPAVSSSMPVLPALASSGTAAVDDEMMAVPSAPRAGDASDVVGANDSRPVTRKFELPAAVKTSTMPPPSSRIVASGGSVGSEEPPMAVAPRTRRGADHLVDKLVNHFGTVEVNDDAVDAMACGTVVVRACIHLQRRVGCKTPHCIVREL